MSGRARFFPVVPIAMLIAAGGCATTIAPPPNVANAATVYVIDYGRHSSLLLPAGPGSFSEYAFGDWDWFALRRTTFGDGVRATFFSRASTLGRRQLRLPEGVSESGVARALRADRALRIDAPHDRAESLRRHLDDLFDRHLDTVTYEVESDMWFVRYQGGYWGCYNCNHQTKDWLQALGCDVRGPALTSRFELDSSGHAGRAAGDAVAGVR